MGFVIPDVEKIFLHMYLKIFSKQTDTTSNWNEWISFICLLEMCAFSNLPFCTQCNEKCIKMIYFNEVSNNRSQLVHPCLRNAREDRVPSREQTKSEIFLFQQTLLGKIKSPTKGGRRALQWIFSFLLLFFKK